MSENEEHKKYEPFKIPGRQPNRNGESGRGAQQAGQDALSKSETSLTDGMFYEIEYGSHPIPGVGRFVRKPQQIVKPVNPESSPESDEIRGLFVRMRDIARAYRAVHDFSRFFDRRVQSENAAIFYKQGMFMKDFSDDFPEKVPFSQYYPYYQMMGYKQLRTYFTWRTEVRKGNVSDTSLSYAFLYIYELLNNIGVETPQEGLEKLMFFWKAFRPINNTVDKYILKWLKDYHVYYELPHSFKEFVTANDLTEHYPGIVDTKDDFDLFCAVSKYNFRKSSFFTDDRKELITGCLRFVTDRLRQIFSENGIDFYKTIFSPPRKISEWTPFGGALFYNWLNQPDRRVILSANEMYVCSRNRWKFSKLVASEDGRQLIGYVTKQAESALRNITKYKYKLTADINMVEHPVLGELRRKGLSLEALINDAVKEYYREATKIVVKVDFSKLSLIRREALATQEKLTVDEVDKVDELKMLTVDEPEEQLSLVEKKPLPVEEQLLPVEEQLSLAEDQPLPVMDADNFTFAVPKEMPVIADDTSSISDEWEALRNALSETEIRALSALLNGEKSLKKFADECGIMLEVLADGINEKAMDYIGDGLLDEEFEIYEDYKDHIKGMVG